MSGAPAIDPDRLQRRASDPAASVWVAASAGSGKTKVLTDRVLRLLLDGTPPQRLLCLTFTKAAAAEMANRVNRSLGDWATAPDGEMRLKLLALTGESPDADAIAKARRLFARVLDVPGGLKIQTIHSFCESLLGRFPVESGVPPHFQVMDEYTSAELIQSAQDYALAASMEDCEGRKALNRLAAILREDKFTELVQSLLANRGRLKQATGDGEDIAAAIDAVFDALNADPNASPEGIIAEACQDGAFDEAGLRRATEVLLDSTKTFQARGKVLAAWLADDPPGRADRFDGYLRTFLTQKMQVYASLLDKKGSGRDPAVVPVLEQEAERLLAVLESHRAAVTAQATAALLRLGGAMLRAYERAKDLRVQYDYDDLIYKTRDLLRTDREGFAAWVLFKLDGGLDHVLIDEAQDTNPEQWQVIAALADEFFAGLGAREVDRTVFAVGDAKQSIFSFQRADPAAFRAYRDYFSERAENAEKTWRPVDLDISFRSSAAVLQAVDAVFAKGTARDGVVESEETLRHHAFRTGQAGLVEVWPAVGPEETDAADWSPPVRRRAVLAPEQRLANLIAQQVKTWIGREPLPARNRPVRPGDIMILLRRRSQFMETLVRALKTAHVPVAGVDRMALTEQLAVMDLMALSRFLLLPEDDLTLAVVLKGPFIGFDDDDLFALCHGRGPRSLWQRLSAEADRSPRYAAARDWLGALLARTDYVPPFELLAGVLTADSRDGQSGWQCLFERLGPEAEDPVDEFLAQALAYERTHPPSLQGFLHWLDAGATEIKRDLEQGDRDEVRVMTVHGAKGLQAPIVMMPDTMAKPRTGSEILWAEGVPLWPPTQAQANELCRTLREEAKRRDADEYRRLLYVAMTRAEDRLYVCGWHGVQRPADDCWYKLVRNGLDDVAEPFDADFSEMLGADGWQGDGLRIAEPQRAEPDAGDTTAVSEAASPSVEDWMRRAAPAEPAPPRPLAPSRPALADPPSLDPLAGTPPGRFRKGLIVHRLLQVLPDLSDAERPDACARFLARPSHGLAPEAQAGVADEVLTILAAPEFAQYFAPGSRAEVPIIGTVDGPEGPEVVSGQVDRLAVKEDYILVLDYKTSRPTPEEQGDVPGSYLRQMAAYRAVLRGIWPDRPVRCALLWTAGPRLMPLNDSLLDRYPLAT